MSQRLFSVAKVGLFLDKYEPGVEKRRDDEVSILKLTLRVQPFDAKLATAIDDGLGGDSGVRPALFKLNHPDPKPHLERVDLSLGCPRQQLHVFAAPDANGRMALNQVKISGTYARTQKDLEGYAFVFRASFGPVGRDELEFVHAWFRTMRFVSFETSEPLLGSNDSDDDEQDDEPPQEGLAPGVPAPMWSDGEEAAAAADDKEPARRLPRRAAKKSAKAKG